VPYLFSAKEFDPETGFYDFGARYLNPRFSKWMSADPALGEYMPDAGRAVASTAPSYANGWRSHADLPGMGGAFQPRNLSLYGYGHHNPATLRDPDGNWIDDNTPEGRWESEANAIFQMQASGEISPQGAGLLRSVVDSQYASQQAYARRQSR